MNPVEQQVAQLKTVAERAVLRDVNCMIEVGAGDVAILHAFGPHEIAWAVDSIDVWCYDEPVAFNATLEQAVEYLVRDDRAWKASQS